MHETRQNLPISAKLPPAYVVWREGTVFTGVCLLTFRGGVTPSQVWPGGSGTPISGPGGYLGYPPGPEMGYPSPQTWDGVNPLPPRQISIASTCYTTGVMPLAFRRTFLYITNKFENCSYVNYQNTIVEPVFYGHSTEWSPPFRSENLLAGPFGRPLNLLIPFTVKIFLHTSWPLTEVLLYWELPCDILVVNLYCWHCFGNWCDHPPEYLDNQPTSVNK